MTSPILTTNWRAGDTIAFSGTAAQRDATPLAASTMRWSVVLNHCTSPDVCHAHPLQQFSGVASGSFTAPSHEYPASQTITLTVNNTTGTATVATTILPRMTSLNIETSPAGLPIVAGSANPRATPFTTTAIENATSGVTAPAAQTYVGLRYVFDHWSDNGAASHTFAAMSGLAPLVATYRPTEDMVTVPPARVFDTRPGYAINTDATKPTAASTHTIRIAGRGGVPTTGATAVAINLTGTEADEPGYLTTWATGPRPNASNLNLTTGATAANLAIVPLAPDGTITLYTHGQTHIIIDVIGWIPANARITTLAPARVFDTRPGYAINTDATKPTAASTHTIRIAGRGGVPTTGATAVAINLTGTEADEPGYLTTWATGPRPNASNLNLTTGATAANLAIVPLAPDGTITLYTHGQTHIIIDVIGWIPAHAPEEGLGQ